MPLRTFDDNYEYCRYCFGAVVIIIVLNGCRSILCCCCWLLLLLLCKKQVVRAESEIILSSSRNRSCPTVQQMKREGMDHCIGVKTIDNRATGPPPTAHRMYPTRNYISIMNTPSEFETKRIVAQLRYRCWRREESRPWAGWIVEVV